jgi:GNAT superfamily N-acetyltransferase
VKATYRRALPEEIPIAADVFLVSLAELARSRGLPMPAGYDRAAVVPAYEHLLESGIFELAELDGKIVGLAAAIVRGPIWFLAMFWVLPEFKLQGIGGPLLERVRRMGEAQGASIRCTWSSIDFGAVAMYLKHGMLPGGPIFTFAGPVLHAPSHEAGLRVSALDVSQASAIDHIVRGTPRAEDHAFWQASNLPGFQVEIDGRTIGYFYAKDGVIGPAAWLREEDGPPFLARALEHAQTQATDVKFVTLGCNTTAIHAATAAGLRLISASHFLHSDEFGKLDQYLPSGPALF